MILAAYIFAALVAVGLLLKLTDRRFQKSDRQSIPEEKNAGEQCCGMHITCERDSLSTAVQTEPEYFDDEELDEFRGRAPEDYTDVEIEKFRDVLLTLLPDDIAPWARSIQLRGIILPPIVRDELLMMVAEVRAARNISQNHVATS